MDAVSEFFNTHQKYCSAPTLANEWCMETHSPMRQIVTTFLENAPDQNCSVPDYAPRGNKLSIECNNSDKNLTLRIAHKGDMFSLRVEDSSKNRDAFSLYCYSTSRDCAVSFSKLPIESRIIYTLEKLIPNKISENSWEENFLTLRRRFDSSSPQFFEKAIIYGREQGYLTGTTPIKDGPSSSPVVEAPMHPLEPAMSENSNSTAYGNVALVAIATACLVGVVVAKVWKKSKDAAQKKQTTLQPIFSRSHIVITTS